MRKNHRKQPESLKAAIGSHVILVYLNTSESRTTKFTPFKLLYDVEAINPEELKHQSLRATSAGEQHQPSDELDLIELDILQDASNLNKYHNETRKWRDKKVVKKDISTRDWVFKRKPNAEKVRKMQSKWDGP